MDKEYSVWWQDLGLPIIITKNESELLNDNARLLAQFNSFEEAHVYSENLDNAGVFQGNITFPYTGHKDNNGYYFLTQLHADDVIQAIKDFNEDYDEDLIANHLSDEVMRKIANNIVDNLLNDLYWTSIISTLENELPFLFEKEEES